MAVPFTAVQAKLEGEPLLRSRWSEVALHGNKEQVVALVHLKTQQESQAMKRGFQDGF
jgi:hypothetical protein